MYLKNQIGKIVAAIMLLLAIMLPTAVQFGHLIEGHDSIACSDKSTHFHKSEKTCEICDFQITSLNYDIAKYPNSILLQVYAHVNSTLDPLHLHYSTLTNKQLRAPPEFS